MVVSALADFLGRPAVGILQGRASDLHRDDDEGYTPDRTARYYAIGIRTTEFPSQDIASYS